MEDEFDKLMEFFSQDSEDKEKKLEGIFKNSMQFFEKFKYVLSTGTEKEKEEMRKKMEIFQQKLKKETSVKQEGAQLSKDDVTQLANDPKNFTPKHWSFLQEAKSKLSEEKQIKKERLESQKEKRMEVLKQKKKKKTKKRSDWMKS